MNPEFPITDEILSAFLDGELADEERKQVEDWLESTPEARQELEDLRQIGALVRAIPLPAVPQGFQASIMQRVEQEAVEVYRRPPQADAAGPNGQLKSTSTSAPAPRPARNGIQRWLSGIVSFAAAMGILVAIGFLIQNQNANQGNVALDEPDLANALPETHDVTAFGGPTAVPDAEMPQESAANQSFPPPMAFDPGPAPSPRGMPPELESPNVEPEASPPGMTGSALQTFIANRSDPSIPLTPGEIGVIASQSVVVELVCVDVSAVENTTNQLQVLLTTNGIVSASGDDAAIDPATLGFGEGEQVMILVETDAVTMARTLAQMDKLNGVMNTRMNYLVASDVTDGNVRDPIRSNLNQVAASYGVPVQPVPPTPGDTPAATSTQESAAGPDGVPIDPAPAPVDVAVGEPAPDAPAQVADDGPQDVNGGYFTAIVGQEQVDMVQQQQIISNSVQNSRSQTSAYEIAQNFDGVEAPESPEGVSGAAGNDAVPTLGPVQVIILVRTLMP
jgi:negative regulator of sigma E activity